MAEKTDFVNVACAFCHGTGIDPFAQLSDRSKCGVCGGKQTVEVPVDRMPCAHCRGTGAIKTFRCTVCDGKGCVSSLPEPTVICSDCVGTGDDFSNTALDCLTCHGRGRVQVHPESMRAS